MTGPPTRRPADWQPTAPGDLHPGDENTETGTPDGPTYTVARVDTARRPLVLDDGIEVPFGAPTARVLAWRPPACP